jgi:cell division septum initiation protein DivIVA
LERYGVRESSEVSVVESPGREDPVTTASSIREPLPESVEPASEHEPLPERVEPSIEPEMPRAVEPSRELETLRAEVHRLETELERYRAHAERTSKLFLSATNYAEWVRESARQDAELALRKARARVERLEARADELERGEHELARLQGELTRLEALTEETRARLSSFLAAGLQTLTSEEAAKQAGGHTSALGDLQDTLHRQAASTSEPVHARLADADRSED